MNSLFGISSYKYQAKNSDIINGFFGFTNKIKLFNDEYYFGFGVYISDHTRGCPT